MYAPLPGPAGEVAVVLQVLLVVQVFFMGLGWGGWSHSLALLQGLAGLVLIVWPAQRRRFAALAVPVGSAVLTGGLLALGLAVSALTECSAAERDAAAELAGPEGQEVELTGSMDQGCYADFTTGLSRQELAAHYEREFAAHGWETGPAGGVEVARARKGDVMVFMEWWQEMPADPPRVRLSVADDVPYR
ncbi:hypothetical protein [Kocuria dechangensis]|uniref:hypothetical protein n=1 Tax=Kocuria dechangensis TaxID=1176249 RepID=UPI00166AD4DA|nr:hypothetical protein [Kocuria dechangensis]